MNLNERGKRWWQMEEPVSPRGKMFHHRKMLAHHRNWREMVHHRSWNQTMVHCMSCWMKLDLADVSWMKKNEHHRYLMGQHKSQKKEPHRSWKKAMLEHHMSQKNLLVLRRNSKEQEEHHRSQKNQLVPHMSSKEGPMRHKSHMSLKGRQEHHILRLKRLMVRHMSWKAGN